MALFFTVTLVLSMAGLVGLLGFKRYELETGRVFWADARPVVAAFFHAALYRVEHTLPELARHWTRYGARVARLALKHALAYAAVAVERGLEKTLRAVREMSARPPGGGEVSIFLREVAEHKKKLAKRTRGKRTIVDE